MACFASLVLKYSNFNSLEKAELHLLFSFIVKTATTFIFDVLLWQHRSSNKVYQLFIFKVLSLTLP